MDLYLTLAIINIEEEQADFITVVTHSGPATTSIFDFFVKFGDFFCGIPQNFVV